MGGTTQSITKVSLLDIQNIAATVLSALEPASNDIRRGEAGNIPPTVADINALNADQPLILAYREYSPETIAEIARDAIS